MTTIAVSVGRDKSVVSRQICPGSTAEGLHQGVAADRARGPSAGLGPERERPVSPVRYLSTR